MFGRAAHRIFLHVASYTAPIKTILNTADEACKPVFQYKTAVFVVLIIVRIATCAMHLSSS
jgi:hypothetical protein